MTDLCGEIIATQFGQTKIVHEVGSKPELILCWVRDSVAIFKKETTLSINSNQLIVNKISRFRAIVGSDHGQGVFRF